MERPEVWGVQELGASAVALRLVVKTEPSKQWAVERELRKRLKTAFDEEGIEIPFPQQTVWHRNVDAVAHKASGSAIAAKSETAETEAETGSEKGSSKQAEAGPDSEGQTDD